MKLRVIALGLTMFFLGAVVCSADSPQMGTWKLNEAKSKFSAGAAKNNTVVYEAAGDQIKVTVDGTDGAGAATHNEWTGKFNGRFYAVTGDPMRSDPYCVYQPTAWKSRGSATDRQTEKHGYRICPQSGNHSRMAERR